MGGLVCLKEVSFKDMAKVSLEIQLYERIKFEMQGCECSKNILELYQTQLSNGSYIMIKEPYSKAINYDLESESIKEILKTVKDILINLA